MNDQPATFRTRTRSVGAHILLGLATLAAMACGQDRLHEGEHAAIFARIFDSPPPAGVEVIHSVLQEYRWRFGTVTTDDWAIEVIAPRSWIDQQIEEFHLVAAGSDDRGSWQFRRIVDRQKRPFRPWYAPGPIESYEPYGDISSVVYVHMLVEKQEQADGGFRVFMSKH